MIDPLISKAVSLGFAALFLLAAWHKLGGNAKFAATLAEYQILPRALIGPASWLLPAVEAGIGAAWLVSAEPRHAAIASVVLLAGYTFSMGINLLRGRVHIGCGCGMTYLAAEQPLSAKLIARNIALIALALVAAMPMSERLFTALDYVTLTATLVASALLYIGASQLLANHSAMASWRDRHD